MDLNVEYSKEFASRFVDELRNTVEAVATRQGYLVTSHVLKQAVATYQELNPGVNRIEGHADGRTPWLADEFPNIVRDAISKYDLYLTGGRFNLVLETEFSLRKEKRAEDFEKIRSALSDEKPVVRVFIGRTPNFRNLGKDNFGIDPIEASVDSPITIVECYWREGSEHLYSSSVFSARVYDRKTVVYEAKSELALEQKK